MKIATLNNCIMLKTYMYTDWIPGHFLAVMSDVK